MHSVYSSFVFNDLKSSKFDAGEYSRMKFGHDKAAKNIGYALAESFYSTHQHSLWKRQCVILPSPFNVIPNAAAIVTHHCMNRLNHLLRDLDVNNVEFSVLRRKLTFTKDYSFMTKEERVELISGDKIFFNKDFLKGKTLLILDDVKITGTNEEMLRRSIAENKIDNDVIFMYYAEYTGEQADIEAEINFSGVKTMKDYIQLALSPDHHVLLRPLKFILSREPEDIKLLLASVNQKTLEKIYYGCLAEGFYKLPEYQRNFSIIANAVV